MELFQALSLSKIAMPETKKIDHTAEHLEQISTGLKNSALNEVRTYIHSLYPAEIANILEGLPLEDREKVWSLISPDIMGTVLVDMHEDVAKGLIDTTDNDHLIQAAASLESDDLVDFLQAIPESLVAKILTKLGVEQGARLESALSYQDDTAGGLMKLEALTMRGDVSLSVAWRYLRRRGEIPPTTESLMVIDKENVFQGVLPLSILLTKPLRSLVSEWMNTNVSAIPYNMPAEEVALLFEQRDLLSAPVVSENGRLLGTITVDDVVDVIRDQADHSLMSMAGLDEEQDMFAPVVDSAKQRSVWLGINLLTAFLASWVIGLFEATLDQIVALAVLMPIVASMGGIAGSQTLTLIIRGLALRQIGDSNAMRLIIKELFVGMLNGVVWAVIVAIVAGIWFQNAGIGFLLGCAMVVNLICAALAGATIPLILQKIGVDPALAGGVLLTTVTDVVGFMTFLGLATLFLL
jgi:magnesium transporter